MGLITTIIEYDQTANFFNLQGLFYGSFLFDELMDFFFRYLTQKYVAVKDF